MNIAIVDDEKIIREQIKSLIEKQKPDCCLDSYCTGEELLKAGKCFDVVFLDIQMDGMNGIDTAKALRERGEDTVLIFIKIRNRNITLDRKTILYVENQGKKVEIHTTAEIIEIYASMKELELQLGESFCRCHRGYLVNMAYIAEYENDSIRLSNGEKIFMAKERYHEFVKKYMRYLRNGGTVYV
jgi:DNA-binding LytR/AlgR family response regulator